MKKVSSAAGPIPQEVYTRVVQAKLYMDQHFNQPLSLKIIAREACLSRFHFHRLFRRIYGQTPHRYLTAKRMDQARQLLSDNRLKIHEVCNQVGFESLSTFSILFKKEMGAPPQFFRRKAMQQKQRSRQEPLSVIPYCFIETFGTDQ